MKYMILLFGSQQDYDSMSGKDATGRDAWTGADFAALGAFMESFTTDLASSGELVDTRGLTAPLHARRIRLENGVPVVTDGPYAETEEVLAGYWIVECESFDRATEIAARLASCPGPDSVPRGPSWTYGRSPIPAPSWTSDRPCPRPAPRTCCASSRRRSSARWCGAYGHFDTAEDAMQEALLAAARQWPDEGLPDDPRAWLITVASRRLTDLLRSEAARQRREDTVARWVLPEHWLAPAADRPAAVSDDTLILLFMCCHPALSAGLADRAHAAGGRRPGHRARSPGRSWCRSRP